MATVSVTERFQALDESFHEMNNAILCAESGKTYKTKGGLRKHRLIIHGVGKPKHCCSSCNKIFHEKHQLQGHLIKLHGSELFTCCEPGCHKAILSKSSLKRHKQNIHDKKSYTCPTCQHVYTHRQVLADHVKAAHNHGSAHGCKTCGASFKWRANLTRHMRIKQ